MKYLFVWFFGLVLGALCALAALYYNPLTQAQAPGPGPGPVLEYGLPGPDVLVLTHGGAPGLPRLPAGIADLWESTIAGVALNVVTLRNEEGAPVAIGSRVSVPSPRSELLFNGAVVDDYWLVTTPGEGSFFVHARNNLWPLLKDIVLPVQYLEQSWQGPGDYEPTIGPRLRASAGVYGATGRFATLHGTARESYRLREFSRERGVEGFLGQLRVAFDDPVAAAE